MHQLVGQSNRLHFHLSEIRKELGFFFSFSSGTSIFTATAIRQNSQDPQIPEKLLEVANPFSKSQLDQSVTWISQAPAGWKVMNILSYRNEHLRTSEEKEKVTGRKTRSSLQTLWSWVWECFPGVTCNCACGPAYEECVHVFIRMFALFPLGSGWGWGGRMATRKTSAHESSRLCKHSQVPSATQTAGCTHTPLPWLSVFLLRWYAKECSSNMWYDADINLSYFTTC